MVNQAGNLTRAVRALGTPGDGTMDAAAANALCEYLRPLASRAASGEWNHEAPATTELIHGAFERLFLKPRALGDRVEWASREEFLAAASQTVKRLLIEEARKRNALKRGGKFRRVPLEDIHDPFRAPPQTILDLAEALEELQRVNERVSRVIELRFFGGLTVEETAAILGVSERTIRRDWDAGRLWLYRSLHGESSRESPRGD